MKTLKNLALTFALLSSSAVLQAADVQSIDWAGYRDKVDGSSKAAIKAREEKFDQFKKFYDEYGFSLDKQPSNVRSGLKVVTETILDTFFIMNTSYPYPKCGEYPQMLDRLSSFKTKFKQVVGNGMAEENAAKDYMTDLMTFWASDYHKSGEDITQDARLVVLMMFALDPDTNAISRAKTFALSDKTRKQKETIRKDGSDFVKKFAELYMHTGDYIKAARDLLGTHFATIRNYTTYEAALQSRVKNKAGQADVKEDPMAELAKRMKAAKVQEQPQPPANQIVINQNIHHHQQNILVVHPGSGNQGPKQGSGAGQVSQQYPAIEDAQQNTLKMIEWFAGKPVLMLTDGKEKESKEEASSQSTPAEQKFTTFLVNVVDGNEVQRVDIVEKINTMMGTQYQLVSDSTGAKLVETGQDEMITIAQAIDMLGIRFDQNTGDISKSRFKKN